MILPWVPIVFLVFAFLAPILGLFYSSAFEISLMLDPAILGTLRFSLWQSFLSTGFSVGGGLLVAILLWRKNLVSDRWIQALLLMPFGVPTVVAATTWLVLLPASLKYSLAAIVIAHTFFNIPFFAAGLIQRLGQIPLAERDSLRTLGGSFWREVQILIWPLTRIRILSLCLQIFSLCLTSFALVLLLGGGPPNQSLETSLLFRIRSGSPHWPSAIALSLWQILLTSLPWLFVYILEDREKNRPRSHVLPTHFSSQRIVFLGRALCAGFCGLYVLPYLIRRGWAFEWPLLLGDSFWSGLLQSMGLALSASLGSLLLCGFVFFSSRRLPKWIEALILIPGSVSPLAMGLALWIMLAAWVDPFEGSLLFLVILHLVMFFPRAYRWLLPHRENFIPSETWALKSLGANAWQAFWLGVWPRWRRPFGAAGALVAAESLGELSAVTLFYSENFAPLSLQVSRLSGQYQFERAQIVSLVLFFLCICLTAVFLGVQRHES